MSELYSVLVPPYLYAEGCVVSVPYVDGGPDVPVISPGQVRDDTDYTNMVVSSPITLNGFINGVNGLDQGTLAVRTTYNVFLISDPSGRLPVAGLLSLDPNRPLMPSVRDVTYAQKRWIGAVNTPANFSTNQFRMLFSVGAGSGRSVYFDESDLSSVAYNDSASNLVPGSIDLSKSVPIPPSSITTSVIGIFSASGYSTTAGDGFSFYTDPPPLGPSLQVLYSMGSSIKSSWPGFELPITFFNGDPLIYYQAFTTTGTFTFKLIILGYRFTV